MKKKKDKSIGAFLGGGTAFEGRLTFSGIVRIDGEFTGNIDATGTLIVGDCGVVNANIQACNVVIGGSVTGNISAERTVEIRPSAKVSGDIQALNILIHPGAIFEGQCLTRIDNEVSEKPAGAKNEVRQEKNGVFILDRI